MSWFTSQKSGSANLPLQYGKTPPWLFQCMVRLYREWLPEPSTALKCCIVRPWVLRLCPSAP